MLAACFLAFCTGFLSLSMEILWIRFFGFASHSMPQGFAFVLATYLIGIAIGAYIGKKFCERKIDLWMVSGVALTISSVCDLAGPWIFASEIFSGYRLLVAGIIIIITALLKAIAFPIAHHLGTSVSSNSVGRDISRVYVSNIMGATLGPLFTGIVLLAVITTQQGFVVVAVLTLLVAMYCLSDMLSKAVVLTTAVVLAAQFVLVLMLNSHALIAKVAMPFGNSIATILENQHGIIVIYKGDNGADIVTGGNVYDGTTNLDPISNANHINRVIVMSALVERPKRVLMIGLSIGTWLKLLTTFPGIESIDVVEINPGYQELIAAYPLQLSGLNDPRVHLYADDGRRWLKSHPDNQYDMIVMNTTYHWRAYSTNLLSREFLKILKSHMNPGAVLEYNTTDSPDVLKTATVIFKHAYTYENFVIAADFDWRGKLHTSKAYEIISLLKMDGKPLYKPGSRDVILRQLNIPIRKIEDVEPFFNNFDRKVEIITDRNLITEYKYGHNLGMIS